MKDAMYKHVNELWHNELKEIKQETIHQPQATTFKYELRLETESSYILKCSHNREMILQHSGNTITLQSYMEANYYAYENALFLTKVI